MVYPRQLFSVFSSYTGLLLGLAFLSIHLMAGAESRFIEIIYSSFIFVGIRWIFHQTLAVVPVPWILVFILTAAIFIILRFGRTLFRKNVQWKKWVRNGLNITGYFIFLFYFLWGLNYDRLSALNRIPMSSEELSREDVFEEFDDQTRLLVDMRSTVTDEMLHGFSHFEMENEVRKDVVNLLKRQGYNVAGEARCKPIWPQGLLLRFGTAGFYFPFAGEAYIDPALHPVQKPFTMAHEFFHAYGIAPEGECNFLAYLSCAASSTPPIAYSAELAYWRYLAASVRKMDLEEYSSQFDALSEAIVRDLSEIKKATDRYPEIMPQFRNATYNSFLKANRVEKGNLDYNRFTEWVIQWKKQGAKRLK